MGFDYLDFRVYQVIDYIIFCDSIAAGAIDEQKKVQNSILNTYISNFSCNDLKDFLT